MAPVTFASLIKNLDIFGHKIEMHFEGSSQYKTIFGACVTLFVYVLVIINTMNIVSDYVS